MGVKEGGVVMVVCTGGVHYESRSGRLGAARETAHRKFQASKGLVEPRIMCVWCRQGEEGQTDRQIEVKVKLGHNSSPLVSSEPVPFYCTGADLLQCYEAKKITAHTHTHTHIHTPCSALLTPRG